MGNNQTFTFIGQPYDSPASQGGIGPSGTQGDPGANATSHYDSGSCQYVCDSQAKDGKDGSAPTQPGGTGGTGADGRPSAGGVLNIGQVIGDVNILVGGSDGQKGGKGGQGGPGGAGGPGGQGATGCAVAPKSGQQGPGGKGGIGGQGGNGGKSGFLTIYYSPAGGAINITTTGCGPGQGGDPGDPGEGNGNLGGGSQGPNGQASDPPKWSINKV